MHLSLHQSLDKGRALFHEINTLELIKTIVLPPEDIGHLRQFLSIGQWFDFQKQAAMDGQKGAVAVINSVTIFQKG